MKAITSITWGALVLMLLFALATPAPTQNVAGYRVLDDHDDSDMMDMDDMEEEVEEEGEEEDDDDEDDADDDDDADEEEEEEEEDDDDESCPSGDDFDYDWFTTYTLLHPTMENEIEIDVDGADEEFTYSWSVSPSSITLDASTTSSVTFTGDNTWEAGVEYTFTVMLTGATSGCEYTTSSETIMSNDAPVAGSYTIEPSTGTALDTDYTHTWETATDSYPANGDLMYELFRVDGEEMTLLSRSSPLTRFHLAGDADNSNLATFKLVITDDGEASTEVTETVTVSPLSDLTETAKTEKIDQKLDELNTVDVDATADEKVQNLGLLDSLSQALAPSDDTDGDATEETAAEIAAKVEVTNKILEAITGNLDTTDDSVVDAVLGAAESVSSNTDYLDEDGRTELLDLFENAAGRDEGLTPDMATAAVGGLSNVLTSLDSGDDVDNSATYEKVDTIVDSAFDAVFAAGSDTREVVIETDNIKASFAKVDKEDVEGTVSAGTTSVEVPAGVATDVADGSSVLVKLVAKTYNSYAADSEIQIDSSIIEFSVKAQTDAGAISDVTVSGLTDPIILDVPVSDGVSCDDVACKYWDTSASPAGWSEEGLTKDTSSDASICRCLSTHATDFALGEADEDEDDNDDTDDDTTSAAIATLSAAALVGMLF